MRGGSKHVETASWRIRTLSIIALAFSLGVAASHAHGHYVRHADCQRWRANVDRWTQVAADATGELMPAETTALTLAHGAMLAVRDQVCGY
jgi:hypothetical protein